MSIHRPPAGSGCARLLAELGVSMTPTDASRSPTTTSPSEAVPSASSSPCMKAFPDATAAHHALRPRAAPTRSSATPTSSPRRSTGLGVLPARPPARAARCWPRASSRHARSTPTSPSPPAAAGRTASTPPAARSSTATTPARWLYQTNEYLGGSAGAARSARRCSRCGRASPLGPRAQAAAVDVYLANSRVVQRRIADDLRSRGRAVAAAARHGRHRAAGADRRSSRDWEPGYALVVSRLLPYKNVDAVIDAVRRTRPTARRRRPRPRGRAAAARGCPTNVRLLGGLSDAQLRWAYAHAGVLVAASHEDFGLTPARGGGVRRTHRRPARRRLPRHDRGGRDRALLRPPATRTRSRRLSAVPSTHPWDRDGSAARAEEFGEARFIDRIRAIPTTCAGLTW